KLALERPDLTIIASGDGRSAKQKADPTEARHIADILEKRGVASQRILLEDESHDTIGNAILTYAKFLQGEKPRKVYVVTSPFHVRRALICFRGVLGPEWEIEAYPSEVDAGDAAKIETDFTATHAFFKDVTPGDLPVLVERLNAKRSSYASLAWLQAKKTKAA